MKLHLQVENQAHGLVVTKISRSRRLSLFSWFRRQPAKICAAPGWAGVSLKMTERTQIRMLSGDPLLQLLRDADHLRLEPSADAKEFRV